MLLSPSTKQNLPYTYYYLKSVIRKLWVTCNMHKNIHLLRSNVKGYGCKAHHIESLISNTREPRGRQLYYLLFSVLTVRLGSFGYTIIYRISRPIRRTFFPEKCDLNSTCVLCAEGIISKLINTRTRIE